MNKIIYVIGDVFENFKEIEGAVHHSEWADSVRKNNYAYPVVACPGQGLTFEQQAYIDKINHQYIPPVQHSACHDGIKTFISQLARTLQSIKEDVKLIYSRNVADKRRDTLANNTFELCKAFSAFYNSRIFFIEQIALEQPPIYLVQAVNELANGLNSALQSLSETEREQLLQYFYEWTNVTPSEFITKIESLTKLMYDHTNINQSLQTAGAFVTLLSNMFHKMSELEYIGMVRENIIVGDESHETIEAQKKRSWSFIG